MGFMTGRNWRSDAYRNTDFFGLVDGLNVARLSTGKTTVTTSPNLTVTAGVSLLPMNSTASQRVQPTRNLTVLTVRFVQLAT